MSARALLRTRRVSAGLTQAALAQQCGVSRQALHAIEAGNAEPAVGVAVQIARALGESVEALFGPPPLDWTAKAALLPANPGASTRAIAGQVNGRVVLHRLPTSDALTPADALLDTPPPRRARAASTKARARVQPLRSSDEIARRLLLTGCDPALGLLARWLSERSPGVSCAWLPAPSLAALRALAADEVHLASTHLFDEPSGEYNLPFIRREFPAREMAVIRIATWEIGWVLAPGNPKGFRGAEDLGRRGLRVLQRPEDAAAQQLLQRLARDAQLPLPPAAWIAPGHTELAQAIALGVGDVGLATRSAALAHRLDFLPLAVERSELVTPRASLQDDRVRRLIDALAQPAFRADLSSLGGYDTRQSGEVLERVA